MSDERRSTRVATLGVLESLLFAAEEPLPLSRLAELIESTPGATRDEIEQLRLHYEQSDGGLQLVEIARGFRLTTKPQYAPYVRALLRPRAARVTRAGLETLAIIAYRQPVTGPEIESLRGVSSSGVLDTLLERGLIEVAGRKEGPGRPRLYRTTQLFLDQFGLAGLRELPALPESDLGEMTESLFADGRLSDVSREEIEQHLAQQAGADRAAVEVTRKAEGEPCVTTVDQETNDAPPDSADRPRSESAGTAGEAPRAASEGDAGSNGAIPPTAEIESAPVEPADAETGGEPSTAKKGSSFGDDFID